MFSQIYKTIKRKMRGIGMGTHDIFRIWSQSDVCAFGVLVPEDPSYDMGIWDGSHGGETIVLSFASINLVTVLLDGDFCPFQLGTAEATKEMYWPKRRQEVGGGKARTYKNQ